MKKSRELDPLAERPTLDFSKGARGKHYKHMQEGTNVVLIAPELMETFPDSDALNEALRSLKNRRPHAQTCMTAACSKQQTTIPPLQHSEHLKQNLSGEPTWPTAF